MSETKHYATRDHIAQGQAYCDHVAAMTAEGLHDKAAIAAELAHRDAEITRLRAELERVKREREWKPIASAPKDGRWFLAYSSASVYMCQWVAAAGAWWDHDELERVPEHWMPLPAPPSASSEPSQCAECSGAGRTGSGYTRENCPACHGTGRVASSEGGAT